MLLTIQENKQIKSHATSHLSFAFLFLQLKDENSKLRRKLTEVQSFSETQTEMYVSF